MLARFSLDYSSVSGYFSDNKNIYYAIIKNPRFKLEIPQNKYILASWGISP
jgi:hypothetical protein